MKILKALPIFFLTVLFVLGSFNHSANAAKWEKLTILNTCGKTISGIYLVISGYESWGQNLLGESTLLQGKDKTTKYDADYTRYDLKLVFSDGQELEWKDNKALKLKGVWRLTIYHNSDTKKYVVHYN